MQRPELERLVRIPLVGAEGVVTSALDPKGVVQVEAERWSAESVAGPVPSGTHVRVVGIQGLTLRVEPALTRVEGSVT